MFDVFYLGIKPGLFPHELVATSIEHARAQCRTRFFWIVSYLADYREFDFLWEPPPWQAHQRHAWPSQWHKDSETYLVPAAGYSDTNYHSGPIVPRISDSTRFEIPLDLIEGFDYSWHPDPTDPPMTYQFGTQHQRTGGPIYRNGSETIKYEKNPRAQRVSAGPYWHIPPGLDLCTFDWSWHPDDTETPYIYEFGTQWQKTGGPKYILPGACDTKYISTQRITKTSRDHHWECPDSVDTETFDWTWHPDSTDSPYIYQFGTQHQRTGGPRYCVPGATEVKYIEQIKILTHQVATAIYEIDHLDGQAGQIPNTARCVRYFDNYLDTLKRLANSVPPQHEFIWICSSICDYSNFDFTWHPEKWQAAMLHVFASDGEKFGDTFFMHVPTFLDRAQRCQLLEWYDVNFVPDLCVPRRPLPRIQHDKDTHVDIIKTTNWSGPLALFLDRDWDQPVPAVPLWRDQTRAVTPLDRGAGAVIVPRDAVASVRTQVYDYGYIDNSRRDWSQAQQLDIVFLSNGESVADENWQHLQMVTHGRARRVDGITGRVESQHAAAMISSTAWYWLVPARLKVNAAFDWSWQPDRLQSAKHYIFYALNPVTGLEYGHMGMIAYNRNLVLETPDRGLDFTLEQPHEVVPIHSGVAQFGNDPYLAWRTAFRECIKLRHSLPNIENEYRLDQWQSIKATGEVAQWTVQGARDALEYYKSVNGDLELLRNTYQWAWLHNHWQHLYAGRSSTI